jgi:hypothetical protein
MGLFGKKDKSENAAPQLPKLPELPKLPGYERSPQLSYGSSDVSAPEFPTIDSVKKSQKEKEPLHQLPSFPNDEMGERFTQDTIKNAVKGQEEEMPEMHDMSDYEIEHEPMEMEPELEKRIIPMDKKEAPTVEKSRTDEDEPVFIRIDKFEDSLKIFDKIRNKLNEIEDLLEQTKEIKEKEKTELSHWEEEVQKLKSQVEKIDEDIFSKLE